MFYKLDISLKLQWWWNILESSPKGWSYLGTHTQLKLCALAYLKFLFKPSSKIIGVQPLFYAYS